MNILGAYHEHENISGSPQTWIKPWLSKSDKAMSLICYTSQTDLFIIVAQDIRQMSLG